MSMRFTACYSCHMRWYLFVLLLAACGPEPDGFLPDGPDGPDGGCDIRETPSPDLVLSDVARDVGAQDEGGVNNGMAAEDFDGDGDIDIFLANPGPRTELLLRQDDGTYTAHPSPPSASFTPAANGVDFDGDGDADLYLSCGMWDASCGNALFRNDGVGADGLPAFTDVTVEMGLWDPDVSTFGGAWADYDLDGDLDLFQACKALQAAPDVVSEDQLWRNDGDAFVNVAVESGLGSPRDGHQAAWIDYDADGWPDIFVPVLGGPNLLYRNLGDGTFEDVTPEALEQPINAFAAVAADFNQDGFQDLLVSGRAERSGNNLEEEQHGLFLSDGAGGFEDMTFGTGLNSDGDGATNIGTMGLQVGDLDLDGFPEVVFGTGDPSSGERNAMGSFVPYGGGLRWVDRTALIDSAGQGAGEGMPPYPYRTHGMVIADLDGDFDTDLYMGNGGGPAAEPNQLWSNETVARNHALRVRLEGVTSNSRGVGAQIRVSDGPEGDSRWASWRTIEATSGFNSSRPTTTLVGLGHCEGPYHVTVTWPGGATQVLEMVEEDDTTLVIQQE